MIYTVIMNKALVQSDDPKLKKLKNFQNNEKILFKFFKASIVFWILLNVFLRSYNFTRDFNEGLILQGARKFIAIGIYIFMFTTSFRVY